MNRFPGSVLALCLLLPLPAAGQTPDVPFSKRGTDLVVVEGQSLLGFVLRQDEGAVEVAVDRQWLRQACPALAAEAISQEEVRQREVVAAWEQRIDAWLATCADQPGLVDFLSSERERIARDNEPAGLARKRFIRLSWPPSQVERVRIQAPERRWLAGIAFQYQLDDVTIRPVEDLREELEQRGVEVDRERVNLADELPAAKISDREWAIRQAIVEFDQSGEWEFQGTGSTFYRKSERPGIAELIGAGIAGSRESALQKLGRELDIPEFRLPPGQTAGGEDRAAVQRLLERATVGGARGMLVKRLGPSVASDEASVEAGFWARLENGEWEEVARWRRSAKLSSQQPLDLKELERDPQVGEALKLIQAIGGGVGPGLWEQALRQGAAVESALGELEGDLGDFFGANASALEWPLRLPDAAGRN